MEIPAAGLERLDLAGPHRDSVRFYRQRVDYPLAAERESRRFVFVEQGGVVAGCVVSEQVGEVTGDEPAPSARVEPLDAAHFEITNRPEPALRGMISLSPSDSEARFRHVCSFQAGRLACVSMHTNTSLTASPEGLSFKFSGLGLMERWGHSCCR